MPGHCSNKVGYCWLSISNVGVPQVLNILSSTAIAHSSSNGSYPVRIAYSKHPTDHISDEKVPISPKFSVLKWPAWSYSRISGARWPYFGGLPESFMDDYGYEWILPLLLKLIIVHFSRAPSFKSNPFVLGLDWPLSSGVMVCKLDNVMFPWTYMHSSCKNLTASRIYFMRYFTVPFPLT